MTNPQSHKDVVDLHLAEIARLDAVIRELRAEVETMRPVFVAALALVDRLRTQSTATWLDEELDLMEAANP